MWVHVAYGRLGNSGMQAGNFPYFSSTRILSSVHHIPLIIFSFSRTRMVTRWINLASRGLYVKMRFMLGCVFYKGMLSEGLHCSPRSCISSSANGLESFNQAKTQHFTFLMIRPLLVNPVGDTAALRLDLFLTKPSKSCIDGSGAQLLQGKSKDEVM